jgi:hypothetical protein
MDLYDEGIWRLLGNDIIELISKCSVLQIYYEIALVEGKQRSWSSTSLKFNFTNFIL